MSKPRTFPGRVHLRQGSFIDIVDKSVIFFLQIKHIKICDKDVPTNRRGQLLTGLRTFKSFENILAWEDCRDACQREPKCYYWTYDRKNKLCELKEGNSLEGIRFFQDKNFFWGHVPEHAPDEDSTPSDGKEWFEKWRKGLGEYSNKLRYGYLSAVEPKTTKPAEEWRTCEVS